MLFIFAFIQSSICFQTFDYTSKPLPYILTLYFGPNEIIEVKIKNKVGTYLSRFDEADEVDFEIDAIDGKGDVTTYGPFDHNSCLAGVYFKTKNFTLKFENKSPKSAKLALLFMDSTKIPTHLDKPYDYDFPVITEDVYDYEKFTSLDSITSPLIYYFEKKRNNIPLIVLYCILALLSIYGLFSF